MPVLYAIDSMALLYRSYFAMIRSTLINSKGLNTSGLYGFITQILKIIEAEQPEYLAVTTDLETPTFRHEQFPMYKATREKMPEDLVEQLPYIPKFVEALGLPYLKVPRYEADDIIGTLMKWCEEKEISGVMVTSDKDYMQLIRTNIVMLNHKNQKLGIDAVKEKFGCTPEQVIEVLGLMGDSSDNIPGVAGVGEKTASKLIQEFGSIATLYQNLDQVSGTKLKQKLIEGKEHALQARELVTIYREVPLSIHFEDLQCTKHHLYDNAQLIELLEELEFKSLLKKYKKTTATFSSPQKPASTDISSAQTAIATVDRKISYELIDSLEQLKTVLATAKQQPYFSCICRFSGADVLTDEITGFALSLQAHTAYFIDLEIGEMATKRNDILALFKTFTETQTSLCITWNCKVLFQYLKRNELFTHTDHYFDVLLAAHFLGITEKKPHLDSLVEDHLHYQRLHPHAVKDSKKQLSLLENPDSYLCFCEDADYIFQFYPILQQRLHQSDMLASSFQKVEMSLSATLAQVEQQGVFFDLPQLQKTTQEFTSKIQEKQESIYEISAEEFNINSILELQKVLYDKLELHIKSGITPKKIKTGNQFSTDEETLEKMAQFPLPHLILQYRELNKLKNTYLDTLPDFIHPKTQRIHSSFQQAITATGRLASDHPNLQNIPIRSENGRKIRSLFIPEHGHTLVSADYSQIELRIVAHYSKDDTFLEAYRTALDIHALTASTIFNVPESEVSRTQRSTAKEVNFGLIYRMGPEKLSMVTQTTKSEAKEFIQKYFEKYSTIHHLQEQFIEFAKKEGYAETLLGRRRYLPALQGKGLQKRLAEGAAINTPIQGSAAEIMKLAMNAVAHRIHQEKLNTKMILTVHDELVFEVPSEEVSYLSELVKFEMENVIYLEVPLVVEIGSGSNWLIAH